MKLKSKGARAFTWVDVLIIIVVLVALASIFLPRLAKSKMRSSKISCTNNLKQVGLAYLQWAIDSGDKFPMQVSVTNGGVMELTEQGSVYEAFLVMSNELNTPKILICPYEKDRSRVVATTFRSSVLADATSLSLPFTNNNNVSYFVGMDADEAKPNTIISGDDNFLVGGVKPKPGVLLLWTNSPVAWTKDRHVSEGNVGLADGSVMGVNTPKFRAVLIKTGMATNRLALP